MSSTNGSELDLQIPVIDISSAEFSTGSQLVDAFATYGFCFVRGEHLGFTSNIVQDMFSLVGRHVHAMKSFFQAKEYLISCPVSTVLQLFPLRKAEMCC